MEYKRYDIVVLPPPQVVAQVVAHSETLASLSSFFVLDGETLYPHLSLYHVPLSDAVLPEVIVALERVSAETAAFHLKQETYYPDRGVWVGVRYVSNKSILDFHAAIIAAVKGFRIVEDDTRYMARWSELSHRQRANLKECGWKDAYTLYSPHISFTKLKQPRAGVLDNLTRHDLSFLVDRIALCELGDNGTCVEIAADLHLAPERTKPPKPFQQ